MSSVCTTPIVSIIVVNFNGMIHLEECLAALRAQRGPTYEVLVVDNASSDDSPAFIQREFSEITLIKSSSNLGYSGAVNIALRQAAGRYVAVINMDAMVSPDWLEPLVTFLEAHPQVGVVTPKIVLYDRPEYINALGQNIHVTALGFNRALNRRDVWNALTPFQVSGLHGAAFVVRRELLDRMGGMHEACFLYHEDVDLSWLTNLMGYDIYCVPASVVRHKYTLKMDPQKLFYLERNRVAMLFANLHWWTLVLLAPLLVLTEAMMLAYCIKHGRHYLRAKARSLAWLWQHRARIRTRHIFVQLLRARSDWQMLRIMHLNYEWDQFLTLGRAQR